ncbi:MAG TPA: UDP-N-acetylmuramoyl-L-alanyl-D-glutamate--2,6-diaminopimelate ligase [Acidobacteriaceae bacterium]|nr:UDP-N-acetylmuramoyl-L-alanyl-D-glutamate--2,6-diaminopimelate ligase [Acidobacteriaceae bacterium]
MRWSDITAELHSKKVAGPADIEISGVQYDSRRVGPGDVFVAMRGGSTDGNRFVATALQQGAAALVTDSAEIFEQLHTSHPELPLALVEHGRRALAEVSAAVFDHPEGKLKLSAVTGTNGKTTTTFLLEQLLTSVGRKSVLLGTIETHIAGDVRPTEHTTPESRDIYATFAEGVLAGCTEAVMEMSSHALEQERVWGLPVDVAIYTNLTQDHLDFHGTMDAYARAKAKLFAGVGAPPPRVAVLNEDDAYAPQMKQAFRGAELMTYSVDTSRGTHRAANLQLAVGKTRFDFVTPSGTIAIQSPLSGRVNVYNLLAAMCAALARGLTLEQIARATPTLKQVPGRFEVVSGSERIGFSVVVDYAHTDDALRNLISLARESVGAHSGRVITLFGCGGDRDRTKRPKMGRAAAEASDLVIVTSDNPRSEQPSAIIDEILPGVRATATPFIVEPDRHAAIERAIRSATPGDIVLLAGKGHEKVQVFADGAIPFDDVAEASRVLQQLREVRA